MSVPSRALPRSRHVLQHVCVAATVAAAGATAAAIHAGAEPSLAAAPIDADDEATDGERQVDRVAVTPQDRVDLRVEPEPVDPSTTARAGALVSLTSAPPLDELVPETEPAPELEDTTEADEPSSADPADEPSTDPAEEAPAEPADESAADEHGIATTHVPVETWEAVARCESGYGGEPDWSINTGNGYYGGLQFSLSSWEWVGGTGYPHEASKATQIEMAERLWERQGWNAWPACSRELGLR